MLIPVVVILGAIIIALPIVLKIHRSKPKTFLRLSAPPTLVDGPLVESLLASKRLHLPWWYTPRWQYPSIVEQTEVDDAQLVKDVAEKKKLGLPNNDGEDINAMKKYFHGYRNGVVFEMGAMNGWDYSVSKTLELLFGWRAILVEGSPEMAKMCPINRPNALSINAVCCSEGMNTLHFSPREDTSVIIELASEVFIKRFHSHLLLDGTTKLDPAKVKALPEVECLPLPRVLEELGVHHINLLVLDCEGCELHILKTFNFDKLRIDVLVVETRSFNSDSPTKVLEFMAKQPDYEVAEKQNGRNTWFKHKDFVPSAAPEKKSDKMVAARD